MITLVKHDLTFNTLTAFSDDDRTMKTYSVSDTLPDDVTAICKSAHQATVYNPRGEAMYTMYAVSADELQRFVYHSKSIWRPRGCTYRIAN